MKIALRYVGNDKALKAKLEKTGGLQHFEPVDAKEVLESKNPDYELPEDGGHVPSHHPSHKVVTSTTGKPLEPEKKEVPQKKSASEGKTVDELKEMLKKAGVQFPPDARKPELEELVDRNVGAAGAEQ